MLLKYINSNRFSVTFFFLLLSVALWIPSIISGNVTAVSFGKGEPFGDLVIAFNNNYQVVASIVAFLLIILNAYLLIQLNIIHIFIPYRTQVPAFFYVIIALSITQLHQLTPALVASSLVFLVFFRVFNAYKSEKTSLNFLDAGLLVAIASLFYFPAIFYFLFLLASLALVRPFIWREWVFALIGLLLPYIFVFSVYYLLGTPAHNFFQGISETFIRTPWNLRMSQVVNWLFIMFFMLVGSYYLANAIDSMKIHARKFFMVFLVFFLFSVLFFLLIPGAGTGMVYFITIPLSYLFSYYFVRCRRNWINDLFMTVFIILLLWQRLA
jgi:hypothetical protein